MLACEQGLENPRVVVPAEPLRHRVEYCLRMVRSNVALSRAAL